MATSNNDKSNNRHSRATRNIVVFHPGSFTFKFGLAEDPFPQVMPHLIAKRVYKGSNNKLKMKMNNKDPILEMKEIALAQIKQHSKAAIDRLNSELIYSFSDELPKYDASNCLKEVIQPSEDNNFSWTNVDDEPLWVVGEQAQRIPPNAQYKLSYPLKYGKFNITPRHSLRTVADELEIIWKYAMTEKLKIPLEKLKDYSVILIISDQFEQAEVKEMVNILLDKLKFHQVALHQESVCASFGAGLPTACVVDIGHTKTSITCIDEGIAIPGRMTLKYGGADVSTALLWLLKHSSARHYFPYKECDFNNERDAELVRILKESLCHLRPTMNLDTFEFRVRQPNAPTKVYQMNVSDALVFAPTGLFYPGLLASPELLMQNSKSNKSQRVIVEDVYEDLLGGEPQTNEEEAPMEETTITIPSLDSAICTCIRAADRPDLRKKLFTTILLVGGTSLLDGLAPILENKVFEQLPKTLEIEKVEVMVNRRDVDPRFLVWKGGAVLPLLDSIDELWIKSKEWEVSGVRCIREKAAFLWQKDL